MHNARKKSKLRKELEQLEKQRKAPNLPTSDHSKLACCGVTFVSEKKLVGHKQLVHLPPSKLQLPFAASSSSSGVSVNAVPAAIVEGVEHSYSSAVEESETNDNFLNVAGISCQQCDMTLFGLKSAPFICHIFGHIAPPPDLARLKFNCNLCREKYLFGIVQVLYHSKVHSDIPFSQIFPSHTDTGPIFAYLDEGVRALFGANDADQVFSIIDSTHLPLFRSVEQGDSADDDSLIDSPPTDQQGDSKSAVVKMMLNSFRCLQCRCILDRDQLPQHVLRHLDVNMDDQAIFQGLTGRNRQGRFQCQLCATSKPFDGLYSLRFALLHALTEHPGVPFSSIFLWSTTTNLLLVSYLRRIVQNLFPKRIVSRVIEILANGSQSRTLPVLTQNRKRKVVLIARPKASSAGPSHSSYKLPIRKSVAVESRVVPIARSLALNSHSYSSNQEVVMKAFAVKSELSNDTDASSPVHALTIMPELYDQMGAGFLKGSVTVKREEVYCPNDKNGIVIGRSEMDHFCDKEAKPSL
uniref:C2H2-type domain-containing protein n=1 Tax=Plectus sambesii TaxID=2011161 RepID=A0A914XLM1_9BILA